MSSFAEFADYVGDQRHAQLAFSRFLWDSDSHGAENYRVGPPKALTNAPTIVPAALAAAIAACLACSIALPLRISFAIATESE
jgi:hypothetical protein